MPKMDGDKIIQSRK